MNCRVCDSQNLEAALDLGKQPWANNFLTKDQVGKEEYYPLRVMFCMECKTAQLDYTVPKETMFGNHSYRSGVTKTLQDHFSGIANEVHALKGAGSVLDIGSNDGTQLKCFKSLGWNVLGVESSIQTARYANEQGIHTINAFFNEDTAHKIGETFDVINAAGVFFHLEELHSVCEGIRLLLKPDGVFVVQFIYAKTMIENGAFDQIYHEHLLYYTIKTVEDLLNRHGLMLVDGYLSPIHGGSIIGFAKHMPQSHTFLTKRYKELMDAENVCETNDIRSWAILGMKVLEMKKNNLEKLHEWDKEGKVVYGMGAPVKGNTLLNTFGIKPNLIECLTERNPLRKGLYAPGSHIPVVMEEDVPLPDVNYVLAWNFKKEILERNKDSRCEFYFPVNP